MLLTKICFVFLTGPNMPRKTHIETIHCPCGTSFNKTYKKHDQSQKHQKWVKKQDENTTNKKPRENTLTKTQRDNLLYFLSGSFQQIISVECLNKNGIKWGNNGVGDRLFPHHNYSVIYSNGKTKTYSENLDDFLDSSMVLSFKSSYQKIKNNGIIGVFLHSLKDNKTNNRPIHPDIKKKCKNGVCVVCGTRSGVLPDHKNDLYNDSRVLSIETQNEDDFQTLCTHCNLRKRQVAKQEKETRKIYSAKNIPQFQFYNFPFPWEHHYYDPTNPKCKEHSYWYDPIEFNRKLSIYVLLRPVLFSIKMI
jgi:hypothetical protein